MKINKKEVILVLISFLVGCIIMFLIVQNTNYFKNNNIIKNNTHVYEKTSLAPAIEKIYDAVVVIQSYKDDNATNLGTGFVYKVDEKYGYILTNEHVIDEDYIKITYTNGTEEEPKILGKDEYLDLAVLRVNKKNIEKVAEIGSSEEMNLGDTVFTVGSPISFEYRGSVTSGILSGKDRMVPTTISNSENSDWVMNVLQIDASINPGNSGGPLLNVNGEVIGVCTLKLMNDNIEGMGFAIPIEYAMSHVESLEKGETINWPVLGISMANLNENSLILKNDLSINTKRTEGVIVLNIKENTGAANSSLKPGDIIIELNGKKVKDKAHLRYVLYQYKSGDNIDIKYIRDEKEHTTKIKLGS